MPFIEVTNRLKITAMDCWTIGNDPKDVIVARVAGTYAVATLWNAVYKEAPESAKPNSICETVTSYYKTIFDYTTCSYNHNVVTNL
ncbi:MAG: hypothetical protein C5S48_04420 [Candidatus Methanogaster sp.]|nr:MAG: hypothetical protein C5S48_04420 [ANME-2 cluster archaeon]